MTGLNVDRERGIITIKRLSVILNQLLTLREKNWNRKNFPLMWYIFARHEVQIDWVTLYEDGWMIRVMEVLNQEFSSGVRIYGFDADAIHRASKDPKFKQSDVRTEDFTIYGQRIKQEAARA